MFHCAWKFFEICFRNFKIRSRISYYWTSYIPLLIPCILWLILGCALTLVQKGNPKTGWPSTVDRANTVDRLAGHAREKRERGKEKQREGERERERYANLTYPKIEARYARIQMDIDEREPQTMAGSHRLLSPSPLALDEISLHPVRGIFHSRQSQLSSYDDFQILSRPIPNYTSLSDTLFFFQGF